MRFSDVEFVDWMFHLKPAAFVRASFKRSTRILFIMILHLVNLKSISEESVIILVDNKSDLETKCVISKEEGFKFAQQNNMLFIETSALDNNTILLGTSNIILNATNVKYGMNLTGLRVTNGTNNKIDMKDGNIKITGNIKSDSSNYAEAYGMDASASGNIIS